MLLREDLDGLAGRVREDPDLQGLLTRLRQRATPVLDRRITVPRQKALLSRDGGVCPEDGTALRFDPLSASAHACPRCGKQWTGERHDRHWARSQHLWLAERAVDLSLLAALDRDAVAGERARVLLEEYGEVYPALPNRDNVLGPSHLFFSTYLESMWLVSYLAAAQILREAELLADETAESINAIADEAAGLIGGFNEGLSNRQTWHAAALAAVAAWFGDEELAQTAIEARTGLLGHLTDGFGEDGLWYEGENYHLFALRGLMLGLQWARVLGMDLLENTELMEHFRSALLAPSLTALPDFTFPARGDSRYGSSLAQPAFLELWEVGRAWLGGDAKIDAWLAALYARPAPGFEPYDAWLHDAGLAPLETRTRRDLSWWALTAMGPAPEQAAAWEPGSMLLPEQGLAVLRNADRYASIECGPRLGGHAHPDELHLTLHANGVHWLADPGTGSYVEPTLAWYRSALAHNAPLLDGENAGGAEAWCEAFDAQDGWAWTRARAGGLTRTVVLGADLVVDVVALEAKAARLLELPWHLPSGVELEGLDPPAEPSTHRPPSVEPRLESLGRARGPVTIRARSGERRLTCHVLAPGAGFARGPVPGPPGTPDKEMVVASTEAAATQWVAVLDLACQDPAQAISEVRRTGETLEIERAGKLVRLRFVPAGIEVEAPERKLVLGGVRQARPSAVARERLGYGFDAVARAMRIWTPPALDGSTEGFDLTEPISLEGEQHYRPSEEPFDPDEFSARAWVNWDGEAFYVAVEITKSDLVLRTPDAPPLDLDNEPDDIHADGLQLYLQPQAGTVSGWVVSLQPEGEVRVRSVAGTTGDATGVQGAWVETETGYCVTLSIPEPRLAGAPEGTSIGFDLIVNEMRPGRQRRAGQLVWSGGDGWVYLRGDRHDPGHFGRLELG